MIETEAVEGVDGILTAGRAKKVMPRMAQQQAISFPGHVIGTASP